MTTDKELIVGIKAGEEHAARVLFHRYLRSVYSFVHARVSGRNELVEELTQDVFLDAFAALNTFDLERDFWVLAEGHRTQKDLATFSQRISSEASSTVVCRPCQADGHCPLP